LLTHPQLITTKRQLNKPTTNWHQCNNNSTATGLQIVATSRELNNPSTTCTLHDNNLSATRTQIIKFNFKSTNRQKFNNSTATTLQELEQIDQQHVKHFTATRSQLITT
jgi:hypothetical protein